MKKLKSIFKQNEIKNVHLIKGGDGPIDKRKMDKKKRKN